MDHKHRTSMHGKISSDMFGASPDLPRIVELDLAKISANPDQPRKYFDEASIAEFAANIEAKGLLQPILVKRINDESYMVVAGERRFRAHQILERATIPAIITEGDADEIALIENIQRENLRAIEEAEALERLIQKHNYTHEDVARVIGKSRAVVTELLSILKLPDEIKDECRTSDGATKSFLIELARMGNGSLDEQREAWQAFKDGRSTVRSIRATRGKKGSEPSPDESPFAKAVRALWVCVKTLEKAPEKPVGEDLERLLRAKQELDKTFTLLEEKKGMNAADQPAEKHVE